MNGVADSDNNRLETIPLIVFHEGLELGSVLLKFTSALLERAFGVRKILCFIKRQKKLLMLGIGLERSPASLA